jgi:hypothetical protein
MRLRSSKDYYRKGQLLKRIYDNGGSYETIAQPFRYKSVVGSTNKSGQLMPGFLNIDGDVTIEAITDLDYAVGDKVILDNGQTNEITQVKSASFNELGRIRGIRRSAFVLTVT